MVTKPTKQQIAQGKARAGGNNPIKVTNSGLKKLGGAALLAASFTPIGRGVKVAATVAKAAKTIKTARTLAEPKSAVKVVSSLPAGLRKIANDKATMLATRAKSGEAAKTSASAKNQKIKADKTKAMKIDIEKVNAYFQRTGKTPSPKVTPFKNGVRVIK